MLKAEKDAELVRNRKTIKDRKISKREREEIRRKEFSFFRSLGMRATDYFQKSTDRLDVSAHVMHPALFPEKRDRERIKDEKD